MGVRTNTDSIFSFFQYITLIIIAVKSCHIIFVERNRYSLTLTWLNQVCFFKLDQVCRSLLNSTVCIWRIVIHFYYIFSCSIPFICYCNIKCNVSIFVFLNLTHFLGKFCIGKSITKWILYKIIIINESFLSCSLIELISYINAFIVINKCSRIERTIICCDDLVCIILDIIICKISNIVEIWSVCQILYPCINCFSAWIYFTGNNLSQGIESSTSCTRTKNHTSDLRILISPIHLHCVGTIVNNNYTIKIFTNKIYHILFCFVQCKIRLPFFKIIVIAIIGICTIFSNGLIIWVKIVIVDYLIHISRKVEALSANTGNNNHCIIRKILCVFQHFFTVGICRRLR